MGTMILSYYNYDDTEKYDKNKPAISLNFVKDPLVSALNAKQCIDYMLKNKYWIKGIFFGKNSIGCMSWILETALQFNVKYLFIFNYQDVLNEIGKSGIDMFLRNNIEIISMT